MTRLQADLALALAGLIWGFGFVAQKDAFAYIGPATFVAAKFLISSFIVLPLALREKGWRPILLSCRNRKKRLALLYLSAAFSAAVLFQQYGIATTTVTKAAFLTGLYVVMVPFIGWLFYRHRFSTVVVIAGLLSLLGVWLLAGGKPGDMLSGLGFGDGLVLLCGLGFATQTVLMGEAARNLRAPFTLSLLQYTAVGLLALGLAAVTESIRLADLLNAWGPIVFSGVASGGIAYTLQAIAQQHTPSADAAIILSSESLFGGLGGVWLLKEKLTLENALGCAIIMAAIILVEAGPLLAWNRSRRSRRRSP